MPLAMLATDPEKIIRKGKALREGTSTVVLGDPGNFLNPSLQTLVVSSHSRILPPVGVSRNLNFGIFPIDLSPPCIEVEEERFDTPISLEVALCCKPRTLEEFSTPGFTTPSLLELLKGKPLFPQYL
jgi:hypothetical protein